VSHRPAVHPAVQRGRRASLPSLTHVPAQQQQQQQPQPPPSQSIAGLAVNGRGGRARARTATARVSVPPSPPVQVAVVPQPPPAQPQPPVVGHELPSLKSGQQTAAQIAAATPQSSHRGTNQPPQQAQQPRLPAIPSLPPVHVAQKARGHRQAHKSESHSPISARQRAKAARRGADS
jgi:hypothetical protein